MQPNPWPNGGQYPPNAAYGAGYAHSYGYYGQGDAYGSASLASSLPATQGDYAAYYGYQTPYLPTSVNAYSYGTYSTPFYGAGTTSPPPVDTPLYPPATSTDQHLPASEAAQSTSTESTTPLYTQTSDSLPPPVNASYQDAYVVSPEEAAMYQRRVGQMTSTYQNPGQNYSEQREEEQNEEEQSVWERTGKLKSVGNFETMNLAKDLVAAIQKQEYFKTELFNLTTFHEVLHLIPQDVEHLEPWESEHEVLPSAAFCILYKFHRMKLTYKQMKNLLEYRDSTFVRGIGLLYLRMSGDPKELWEWYEPLLSDREEVFLSKDGRVIMSVGIFAKKLLTEQKHFGQILPRIPIPRQKEIKERMSVVLPDQHRRSRSPGPPRRTRSRSPRRSRSRERGSRPRERSRERSRERDRRQRDRRRDVDWGHERRDDRQRDRERRDGGEEREKRREKDKESGRKRSRSPSPPKEWPSHEPKKAKVDLNALQQMYGSSSDPYESAAPNPNANLGTAETIRIGQKKK